ncbi:efflux RND transporter permease subunit [uncultured Microbulbifer sp.]|uniref:efflux RND transporter permease subunit n=1 Tax=uncultured Microbulbifer sp. TaxID=348147 RepID=UPI00262911A8|nr:efflux RND transporter permease subunit [uncultured Microbulbifer sp.]
MDIFAKRPVISIVISVVLLLSGGFAAFKIAVVQFPQLESANILITTAYPGASPNVVQGFVTDPVERTAMTIPGVDYVESTTTAGLSNVAVWLKLNENSSEALAELTSRLNQIRFELPNDALDPSISVRRSDQPQALFYLNVNSEGWSRSTITDYLARHVQPQLASIEGIQRIALEGGRDPAMRIWLDPARLAVLSLSADQVLQALSNNNVLAAIGKTENAGQQISLQSNATLRSVGDFERLIVSNREGVLIRLMDIARVELGEDRGDDLSRVDQAETVFISVWSLPGANAIEIGDELYKRLERVNATLPRGLDIEIAFDATIYMRNALKEIVTTLLETVLLVGLVVLLLMGSFRTSLVPLVTIPISILGAIGLIHAIGFTLNLLTILAIVLSVGLVVDDAIVVVENVARHMRTGKSRLEAALTSSRELFAPIVAMTLTMAAVYIPIGFVSGLTGALFREFAFTLAIAVLISGVVAVTLSPIMSAQVCADKGKESAGSRFMNSIFDRVRNVYRTLLTSILVWRPQVTFMAFFLSLLVIPFFLLSAKELAPVEDQGSILVIIESPPEAHVQYTGNYMQDVVKIATELPGFSQMWQVLTPSGGFAGIEFIDYTDRDFTVQEIRDSVFQKMSGITGLRVLPVMPSALPAAGQFDVEMVIQSPDTYDEMAQYIAPLIDAAYASGHFTFVQTDLHIDQHQVRLQLDHDRIADLGLNVQQVSAQLAALISDQDVNRFDANGKSYRVIPMVEGYARSDPHTLLNLQLMTPAGDLVPVRMIATLERDTGPRALGKFNQLRSFKIMGGIHSGTTTDAALSALEAAAKDIIPNNYTLDYAGISRSLRAEGTSFVSVLLISMTLVYLLLAIQFNSFRAPLVVLLGSVPLALSGAMLFSFLGLTTINIYAQIGFITLVGLVAKNGILITEFANELQQQGLMKLEAIIEAAAVRLRPILMTTLATVVGHFPLVLVTGAGAEARNSIGIILVAGMVIGTLFTLFILPCIYILFGDTLNTYQEQATGETVVKFNDEGVVAYNPTR